MSAVNPFTPPQAQVADPHNAAAYSTPKVWSASGRIGRARYLAYTMVGYLVVALVAGLLAGAGAAIGQSAVTGLVFLAMIPYAVLLILSAIQRAHDMNWSGWSILLCFIPLVGLLWIFKAGTPAANRFGAPPPPNGKGVLIGAWCVLIIPTIGILAAVALPAYQAYVQRAQATQMQAQPENALQEPQR